jgi:hypothetical protein
VAFAIQVKITGLQDSLKRLTSLDAKVRKKTLREALKAGAVELRKEARALAPVSTDPRLVPGLLKASMGEKIKVYRSGTVVAIIGPRSGFKKNKKTGQRERTAIGRRAERVAGKKNLGKQALSQNPTQYAHLAGPGRKQTFMTDALANAQARAGEAIKAVIEEAVR